MIEYRIHHIIEIDPNSLGAISKLISSLDKNTDAVTKLTMKTQDLIDAGIALSTAADGLSQHADLLVASAERVVNALQNADLTKDQEKAVADLKQKAIDTGAERDKVDAEVTKLDGILPSPAPTGTPGEVPAPVEPAPPLVPSVV